MTGIIIHLVSIALVTSCLFMLFIFIKNGGSFSTPKKPSRYFKQYNPYQDEWL